MENVSHLNNNKIDLRKHQSALIEAENASMESLGKCFKASAAFVEFFREMRMSVVDPEVRDMLGRIPEIIRQAASVPLAISEVHAAADSMIANSPHHRDVVLSGGLPKRPPRQNG